MFIVTNLHYWSLRNINMSLKCIWIFSHLICSDVMVTYWAIPSAFSQKREGTARLGWSLLAGYLAPPQQMPELFPELGEPWHLLCFTCLGDPWIFLFVWICGNRACFIRLVLILIRTWTLVTCYLGSKYRSPYLEVVKCHNIGI